MSISSKVSSHTKPFATAGLIAKGIVYTLLGILGCMAAFHIGGESTSDTDKKGVFRLIEKQAGGKVVLAIIAVGLLCYTIWRVIQCFADTEQKGSDAKGFAVRARYLFSGLVYSSVAGFAIKRLFSGKESSGNGKQGIVEEVLSKPFGHWVVGITAAAILGVGIYQIFYGLSEKYKKHVDKLNRGTNKSKLLVAGKIGYVSRGIVWLIIGWLFAKAAFHSNAAEAGDTSSAFQFLSNAWYGEYLVATVGAGLICYGGFNFIRARYESFD